MGYYLTILSASVYHLYMRTNAADVKREAAAEAKIDRDFYRELTPTERREIKQQIACGSGGHLPLAGLWRTLQPETDGRLHARCSCGSAVSRRAFPVAA